MELSETFASLGIALGLGLLVGLQREQAATPLAGLRTFALITVLGTICGLLGTTFGGWVVAAGFLALTGALLTGHIAELRGEKVESGVTTEVAALAMFGVGAYLVGGHREAAIMMGGGIAILLHFKGQLHGIAARLGEDTKSIMQFALLSLVILPILPNRSYGPYDVLNPRQVWWMVVLIVGIELGGYIVYKFFGPRAGLLTAGILGGVISSTATTVSYARQTSAEDQDKRSATVILLASAVSCGLVLVEIGVVAPGFLRTAAAPVSILVVLLGAVPVVRWFRHTKEGGVMPAQGNPSELKAALYFALLYAGILLAIAWVKDSFGAQGLYLVAVFSGLAEVHALALSTAQLVETGRLDGGQGWRIITVALLSSLAFKVVVVATLGTRSLFRRVIAPYIVTISVGAGILMAW